MEATVLQTPEGGSDFKARLLQCAGLRHQVILLLHYVEHHSVIPLSPHSFDRYLVPTMQNHSQDYSHREEVAWTVLATARDSEATVSIERTGRWGMDALPSYIGHSRSPC